METTQPVHMRPDSTPTPGGWIQVLCGETEQLSAWNRRAPRLKWIRTADAVTCPKCRDRLRDPLGQLPIKGL